MSASRLATLRAHVDRWDGLNGADARELLDIAEQAGAGVEFAIQTYDEPMRPDMPSERMEQVDADLAREQWPDVDGVWTRLVGPWRSASGQL